MERAEGRVLARHWRWEKDREGLAWLTFDKQGESTNTFSREALQELWLMLDQIAAERPRGLIIRSAKDSFIGGADIQEFANFKGPQDAIAFTKLGWDTFQKLHDLPFPTTAMVNGFCMGGGMEMSLACDYIVALDDPKTRFAQPEVMVGVIPAWHAMEWLPQRVGPAAAMDLLLTGKTIDAQRAKRMGLADAAVPLRIFENTARDTDSFALTVKPGCDPIITRFAPVGWRLDRGQLIMLAAGGQSWRFEENEEAVWSRVPAMRPPLVMNRPPPAP